MPRGTSVAQLNVKFLRKVLFSNLSVNPSLPVIAVIARCSCYSIYSFFCIEKVKTSSYL
jgi:hypothetical protein